MKRKAVALSLLLCVDFTMAAQPAVDTLLFTITLNNDSTSIYGCRWNDKVRSTLAGPVLMAGKHLLFYSQNGYVLYNESGKLLDSYSLLRQNSASAKKGEAPLLLAYPLDSLTLIFYRQVKGASGQEEIYLKKIFKKDFKRVTTTTYEIYGHITRGQLFNLAANSITDEMGSRNYLMPQLVGYTALQGGTRWWSIDRLYSFTSPLIVEDRGECTSFFPGLKSDQKCEMQSHQIEPLGVYRMQGRWYYFGLASSLGNTEDEYYQLLVLCDQGGNLLYSSKLLKQEIADAVLQYVEKTNTNYTVRKAVRHVFVPVIDRRGDICYGVIDFDKKNIAVYRRMFLRYIRQEAKRIPEKVFERANELAYTPLMLDCTEDSDEGVLPEITILTDDGIKALSRKSLIRKGYFITVHRMKDGALKTRLSRTQERLPENVKNAQRSLAKKILAWCPFSVALNHDERGRLNFLHYGPDDEVLSARVLSVTEEFDVFVRVDCEKWAEVVQFDSEGAFINRFIFNQQDYNIRKDLVVVGRHGNIAEEDYESPKGKQQYFIWRLMSADKRHSMD
ncbi:MAG: hypothetical protein JXA18_15765 [Chitinispirillaceae bacterium]|nr:hypothetical protein [Chitinispirillaceae bacterium]